METSDFLTAGGKWHFRQTLCYYKSLTIIQIVLQRQHVHDDNDSLNDYSGFNKQRNCLFLKTFFPYLNSLL